VARKALSRTRAKRTIKILDFVADDGGNLALEVDLDFDTLAAESLPIVELAP
jgi:hypothetical protein